MDAIFIQKIKEKILTCSQICIQTYENGENTIRFATFYV